MTSWKIVILSILALPRTSDALSIIRIATRPSPLALEQAQSVADALQKVHPSLSTEFVILNSTSEHSIHNKATQDQPLAMTPNVDFTSVIDSAIVNGDADIGIHSLKDVPPSHKWKTGESLAIACYLPRACPFDVLIGGDGGISLETLANGARVGSASTRRQSQLLSIRPDIQVVNLRGNVQTRLEYLRNGIVDALIMARAGLNRLHVSVKGTTVLSAEEMLPGPGQGIVCVVCRQDNVETMKLLKSIDDCHARLAATAERQVLNTVDQHVAKPYAGRPPLAAFMCIDDNNGWLLRARLLRPDGTQMLQVERHVPRDCSVDDARLVGEDAGKELVQLAGLHFFQ